MDLGLKGKKVILTGGSRGIGRAALELFAAEGCDVAFFSRNQAQVDDTVAALSRHGGAVHGSTFDLNDMTGYPAWLNGAAEQLGGCDIFVPGASSSGSQATGDWQKGFDFDLMGTVRGCETLEPHLAKSGAGSVIIMSSTAAFETFIVPQAFNAIKAALLTYSKQLSQAWGPKGIRVNAISPGPVSFPTGNWEAIKSGMPDFYKATEAQFALGRFGTPEDIARTLVFLASPASGYTTGTNIVIDGGYTKRVQF
jgi:NAD(P)-dependent dehydrogenase (short-subunit alcohol dehydrogenase family)